MKRLKVLEDILLFFIGTSAPNSDSAATPFFDDFLCLSLRADEFSDVVSFGVVDGLFGEIDFFELLQRFIILRRYESNLIEMYVDLIFIQS